MILPGGFEKLDYFENRVLFRLPLKTKAKIGGEFINSSERNSCQTYHFAKQPASLAQSENAFCGLNQSTYI